MLKRLFLVHDFLTRISFSAAALCVAFMAAAFCYEVLARYFFNAPTDWASPLVSYLLCALVFLAMPELTRQAAHVTITIVIDRLTGPSAEVLAVGIRILAMSACLLAAWFSLDASLNQFEQNVWTNPPFAVPKWLISALIPYGMFSAALYFLRQLCFPRVSQFQG